MAWKQYGLLIRKCIEWRTCRRVQRMCVDMYSRCESASSSSLRCVLRRRGRGDQANIVLGLLILEQMETVKVAPKEVTQGEVGVSRQCVA